MSRWTAELTVPVTPENSLVNGHKPCMKADVEIISAWPNLDFAAAWIDNGPSPMGNPGPYLKVPGPDDSAHRVYCKFQVGDALSVARMRGVVVHVRPWFKMLGWVWLVEIAQK